MMHETQMKAVAGSVGAAATGGKKVGLEEYYSEAGPDYAAWSAEYNMHFGYYGRGMNPFDREAMLERMNGEVLKRLRVGGGAGAVRLLDMGCCLSVTLRSFAERLPLAELAGITLVPWQIEEGTRLNEARGLGERIRLVEGDYELTPFAAETMDGAYALESSCHAHGAHKRLLLEEAHRVLRRGGRFVMADGFLESGAALRMWQRRIYRKLCECWVIESLGELDAVLGEMERAGFGEITVERLQFRVAPSVFHIPWVTLKFLVREVVFGRRKMTRARWNNVLAPVLLPLVGWPVGPMVYCVVSGTKL